MKSRLVVFEDSRFSITIHESLAAVSGKAHQPGIYSSPLRLLPFGNTYRMYGIQTYPTRRSSVPLGPSDGGSPSRPWFKLIPRAETFMSPNSSLSSKELRAIPMVLLYHSLSRQARQCLIGSARLRSPQMAKPGIVTNPETQHPTWYIVPVTDAWLIY